MAADKTFRTVRYLPAQPVVRKPLFGYLAPFVGIAHLNGRARLGCAAASLFEIVGGKTEHGRQAAGNRFDDVLTTAVHQAAADKGGIGGGIIGIKLAHAVAYPNLRIGGHCLAVAAFLRAKTQR